MHKLRTSNKGGNMDINSFEVVEYNEQLIYAIQYYSEEKDFWVSYCFDNNEVILTTLFPRDVRLPMGEI